MLIWFGFVVPCTSPISRDMRVLTSTMLISLALTLFFWLFCNIRLGTIHLLGLFSSGTLSMSLNRVSHSRSCGEFDLVTTFVILGTIRFVKAVDKRSVGFGSVKWLVLVFRIRCVAFLLVDFYFKFFFFCFWFALSSFLLILARSSNRPLLRTEFPSWFWWRAYFAVLRGLFSVFKFLRISGLLPATGDIDSLDER